MDYLNLYVEEALREKTNEVSLSLENNINIRVDSRTYNNYSIITGYYDEGNADYGIYVIRGIRGKGLAKAGPIDFLGDGLQRTLEAYK